MSRIAHTLSTLKAQGRQALIPYVTAGFPFADVTPELMHAMVAGGQRHHRTGRAVLRPHGRWPRDSESRRKSADIRHWHDAGAGHGAHFRQTDTTTPVVLMGYANPVERYDLQARQVAAKPVPLCAMLLQPAWMAC
jgi:tryptophan synthase alpha chain